VHNGFLLLTAIYQQKLAAWGLGLAQSTDFSEADLPASWLLTATAGSIVGFALVWFARTKHQQSDHLSLRT
jgi:hypothetical protein